MTTQAHLQALDDQIKNHTGQRNSATIVFFVGLLTAPFGVGILLILWAVVNYYRHKGAIQQLQAERLRVLRSGEVG